MDAPAAPPSSRLKAWLPIALGAVAVGVVIGGGVILLTREPAPPPAAGPIDVAFIPQRGSDPSSAPMPRPQQSSLDMVPKLGFGAPAEAPPTPLEKAAAGFREAIRGSEATLSSLAQDYTRRFPVIRQYGRDWMSYPDLKKLNDDYMRDHDPIAFLRGLAASPSFPQLLRKYAGRPEITSFVSDCMTKAPAGAVTASLDYLEKDKKLDGFVQDVAGAAGVPPAMLAGAKAAAGRQDLDVAKLAGQALGEGRKTPSR